MERWEAVLRHMATFEPGAFGSISPEEARAALARVAELETLGRGLSISLDATRRRLAEVEAAGQALLAQIERNGPHGQYVREFRAVLG